MHGRAEECMLAQSDVPSAIVGLPEREEKLVLQQLVGYRCSTQDVEGPIVVPSRELERDATSRLVGCSTRVVDSDTRIDDGCCRTGVIRQVAEILVRPSRVEAFEHPRDLRMQGLSASCREVRVYSVSHDGV